MIERLFIKNYAIIDLLELEFGKGFQVFTGETGAGKSIIIGALGLLLGDKGDASSIRNGEERALVEGEFSIHHSAVRQKLRELEIEDAETLLIRREIVAGGKSRVFINGLQEPLQKLEDLGEWLVDVHGQHDHQQLLNQKIHLDILDNYGNFQEDKISLKKLYHEYLNKTEEIRELEQDEKKLFEEKSFWESAVKEIEKAALENDEEVLLSESLKRMENAEKISISFHQAFDLIYEDEQSASGRLSKAVQSMQEIAGFDQRYEEILEILEDASTKVSESADLIADYMDELDFDQKTMEETIDRLEMIKDLKRKYKKISVEELNFYAEECKQKLSRFENRSEELSRLKKEVEEVKSKLIEFSMALSRKRQEAAKELAEKIQAELAFLGMEKSSMVVDIKYVKEEGSAFVVNNIPLKMSDTGIDRAEFFISSNAGEEPKPLKKVASGGEISRVMLALKAILSKSDVIESLIFDEIDTGIGGLTANNVALRLKDIARDKQLIAITHLAQIASRSDAHFYISKEIKDGKTFTRVEKIENEKRVNEIARMLGGESETSKAHAREMLEKK